jgi:hypothetical protein
MGAKARIYQAEGNLQEAAKLLVEVNAKTPSDSALDKITQLRLERNLDEVIRLLQAQQAQFQVASDINKGGSQVPLAMVQRLASDTAVAKPPLNRRAIRSSRCAKINRITTCLRECCLWLMPPLGRRTQL